MVKTREFFTDKVTGIEFTWYHDEPSGTAVNTEQMTHVFVRWPDGKTLQFSQQEWNDFQDAELALWSFIVRRKAQAMGVKIANRTAGVR